MTAPGHETIHVVVTCRNAAPWVDACITSLKGQSWRRFFCVVVEDASTDGTRDRICRAIEPDPRFRLISLPERVWAARARAIGLEHLDDARPDEIVVLIDGDDWLCDRMALSVLHAAHHERRLLVTYGNYVRTDGVPSPAREYPLRVAFTGTFRRCPWYAGHVRSFRYGLWDHVRDDELRDSRGDFFRVATDRALFLPLLELAGTRSGFIRRPLYVYNCARQPARPHPDLEAERVVREIHSRSPYGPLSLADAVRLLGPRPCGGRDGSAFVQ